MPEIGWTADPNKLLAMEAYSATIQVLLDKLLVVNDPLLSSNSVGV